MPVSVATRKRFFGELPRVVDHLLGREDLRAPVGERHRLARAAALGMDEQLGVRRVAMPALDVGGADAGVHVAFAHPDRQRAARLVLQPEAEVHVRAGTGSPVPAGIASITCFALPEVQQ